MTDRAISPLRRRLIEAPQLARRAESAPSRPAFCVLTTRKHLETLGIDGQPLQLVESDPGALRHWAPRVEATL